MYRWTRGSATAACRPWHSVGFSNPCSQKYVAPAIIRFPANTRFIDNTRQHTCCALCTSRRQLELSRHAETAAFSRGTGIAAAAEAPRAGASPASARAAAPEDGLARSAASAPQPQILSGSNETVSELVQLQAQERAKSEQGHTWNLLVARSAASTEAAAMHSDRRRVLRRRSVGVGRLREASTQ
jgi:hypothetical protein